MITREQIYGKEAMEIFRLITTYHCVHRNHLLRIFPNKEKQVDNLLKYLLRQGRIFTSPDTADIFFDNFECSIDIEMMSALWVLADFSDKSEYHCTGEFPVKILFFADASVFDIIYVSEGRETLVNCALMQSDDESKRLVIIENVEQIDKLSIPNTAAYCLVNLNSGETQYFTTQRFRIYQLNFENDHQTKKFAFEGIDTLYKAGYSQPPASEYRLVYDGYIECNMNDDSEKQLNRIFRTYNDTLPQDYNGRSISPSDVVELYDDNNRRYYYRDYNSFCQVKFTPFMAKPMKQG